MSQTVTAVQAPSAVGRIDGHTNYASQDFVVVSGVTVNVGDFVYFSAGQVTNATVSGDSRLVGLAEGTVVGDGTKTVTVCIDPMMKYLIKASTALNVNTIGQYFDLQGAAGAQVINNSASTTTGAFILLAVGAQTAPPTPVTGIAGANTSSYGIFKLVESALSPLGS